MATDRRTFLLAGLAGFGATALLGAGATGVAGAIGPSPLTSPRPVRAPSSGPGTLVLITLRGGNDALNTVIPVDDATYRESRGALAVDPEAALALDDGFALHPALSGCKALWDDERLAIVHGVGFGSLDRSHFHCMDVWQAGDEDDLESGWLGRWLDREGTDVLDAVAVGRRLPLAFRGASRSAAVVPVGPFELPGNATLRRHLTTLGGEKGRAPLAAAVARSTADLLAVIDTVGPLAPSGGATAELDENAGGASAAPEGAPARGGANSLAGQLDTVARLIKAGVPTRAFGVELGGFDTHANQAPVHEALLTQLDGALSGFLGQVGDRPVTVAVYSEFGRRMRANGSSGTDHGGGGTVLLAGAVRPGFHGDAPPLDDLVDGDLRTTVDFRAVFGGLLEGVLGVDAADVLEGAPRPLALV